METLEPLNLEQQEQFQATVGMTLYLWDALSIAINNDPRANTPAADDIRVNFTDAVVDEFREKLPDIIDLEELLYTFMEDVFEAIVDDDSLTPTAEALIRRYQSIARGEPGDLDELKARYETKKSKGGDRHVRATVGEEDQDTDASYTDESEDEDEDRMEGVVQQPAKPKKEKPIPEVDEDGFTTVTRKR